jgi:hypothetical protein
VDSERPVQRLDPASIRAVARVFLLLGFVGLWCSLIRLLTGRPVTPLPMLMAAAVTAAVMAVGRREWPLAPSLNGWDEAVAFMGFAALSHVVMQLADS